jgi:hypothetical protein
MKTYCWRYFTRKKYFTSDLSGKNFPLNEKIKGKYIRESIMKMAPGLVKHSCPSFAQFPGREQGVVREKVKTGKLFSHPGFVDNIIAEKITNAGMQYLQDIIANKHHHARAQITTKLRYIAADIKEGGEWARKIGYR